MNKTSDLTSAWIERTFESFLQNLQTLAPHKVLLIIGPRQVGKSSLLQHCALEGMQVISLDDLAIRTRANQDPLLFSREIRSPSIIDEIQYAPQILAPIKQLADASPQNVPMIWLTGSQNFEVMRGVQETLAGRVVIVRLLGLSDQEKQLPTTQSPVEYFTNLCASSFPALMPIDQQEQRDRFFGSYIQTYIERDVRELLGIQKRREFEIFLKLCALRTAQLINFDDIGRDSGISGATAKEWISILEDSFILKTIYPYFTSKSKRLTKTPKLYFLDAGLAAFLAGWSTSEAARLGPMSGALFETHVFGQIYRALLHRGRIADISFLRTRENHEVDFIVRTSLGYLPIEVKLGKPHISSLVNDEKLRSLDVNLQGLVISLLGGETSVPLNDFWSMLHPNALKFIEAVIA